MAGMRHTPTQFGFTLIELVVVVLIIAVIAGVTITAFNNAFVDEKEETAALFEMTQIRDAILKFKRDNPSHALTATNLCSPADVSFLLTNGYDIDDVCDDIPEGVITGWNENYRLGWQGPYISKLGNPTDTSIADIEHDGTVVSETALSNVPVVNDPYNNPYYFFELDDNDAARIVSFGSDGIYDSAGTGCVTAGGDDIIVCLR